MYDHKMSIEEKFDFKIYILQEKVKIKENKAMEELHECKKEKCNCAENKNQVVKIWKLKGSLFKSNDIKQRVKIKK